LSHPPLTAAEVIERLGLTPLEVEGGWFRETHRSELTVFGASLHAEGDGRTASTAIYYLLTPDTFSALHRLPHDEVYHFLLGDPVEMLQLAPGAPTRRVVLGNDLRAGDTLQEIVHANVWQGSRLRAGGAWALMGVTVAPGFEYRDYEHGEPDTLCAQWPDAAGEIRGLLR
jgi:predicted cupin superfamily sugar epimerase